MSDEAATPPWVPPLLGLTRPRPPRSEAARVIAQTFGRRGALLGGLWLLLIAFCAVFAPFLANSHPLVLKLKGGPWSSPLLVHLTPSDGWWLVMALTLTVLALWRRLSWGRKVLIFLLAAVLALPLVMVLFKQAPTVIYDRYRTLTHEGQVEHAIYVLIPYSPSDRLGDQFDAADPHPRSPSRSHWLGTELNGADILSRMIHACRIAMSVGFISTGIAVVLGIIIGGLMGYFSGWVDLLGMRAVEIFDAIPRFYLLLSFMAFWRNERTVLYLIMIIIGLTGWTGYALFIRAEFLKLRQQDFVAAARAAGLPLWSILFRHMLPNGVTPVLVSASFGIAGAMNVENVLSFLGIGLIEEPSWGQLIGQATSSGGSFRWWLAIYPGLALSLTIFAYILIGEALRDVIDPYTRRTDA